MDETPTAPPPAEPKKSGTGALIAALLLTTVIGGGGGAFLGMSQVETISAVATKRANVAQKADENALAWDKETTVARLTPIISNLAFPTGARLRLDTAMVFDVAAVEDVERMKAVVAEDVLAFVRTVALGELTGASAFDHLRDDLNERVRAVSAGSVTELLIEGMVLQ